jgi:hypothetical protein
MNWEQGFPVLTLLIGYGTRAFSEWVQHRRARHTRLVERRTSFQRETLLALQDSAMSLIQTTGHMHMHDMMNYRKTGEWHSELYPEKWNSQSQTDQGTTKILQARIRDEKIRRLTSELKDASTVVGLTSDPEKADRAMRDMGATFERLNDRIGVVLRKLEDEPENC